LSSNGTKLMVLGYPGIYTSSDSGATWTSNSAPVEVWRNNQHYRSTLRTTRSCSHGKTSFQPWASSRSAPPT
jgi:hypothetical protein